MADNEKTPTTGVRFKRRSPRSSVRKVYSVPRTCRRHTPFRKTPHSRRLREKAQSRIQRTPPQHHNEDTEARPGTSHKHMKATSRPEQELVKKTWRLFKVSPLYKFSHKPSDLKKYSRLLSVYIASENRKGFAIDAGEEQAHSAQITIFKGLSPGSADKDAVQFELKARPKKGGEPKVVLQGILLGVHIEDQVKHSVSPELTVLPVLMIKGLIGPERQLIQWLKVQFDTHITPLTFSSYDLSWMVAMWSGFVPEKDHKPVELLYTVPEEIKGLSKITMTIQPSHCKLLWDSIHDSEDDEFHEDEVLAFIESLEDHFFHHFGIYLKALHLGRVGNSTAYIGSDGKIKMFSAERVCQVLSHLTELAIEQVIMI